MKRGDPALKLLGEVSRENLMAHTKEISRYVRVSGSSEESESLDYIKARLNEYGFAVSEYSFDSYIGIPSSGTVSVLGSNTKFRGTVPALSRPTSAKGLAGELVYVGHPTAKSLAKAKGKIALIDGLSSPWAARLAEESGATAQIFSNDSRAHEGTVSVVWGNPTPQTLGELPQTPCLNLSRPEGEELRSMVSQGRRKVVLRTRVENSWRKIPVLTGDLETDGDFVLLSGHIDSWHLGAMDNAAANALMLEVGRVIAAHREILARGLRLAFWSGHSHGRYAGSTWYADNKWKELHEQCVAHVNVDSIGAVGASDLSHQQVMAEAEEFVSSSISLVTGITPAAERFSRAGDQSFWGLGITSLLCELSEQPHPERVGDLTPWGFWWHTPEDTFDKIDEENIIRDTKVYLEVVGSLCSREVLPFRFARVVQEMIERIGQFEKSAGGKFDLSELLEAARALHSRVDEFERIILGGVNGEVRKRMVNEVLKQLGRLLIPVNYTKEGPFGHDLALETSPLPGLASMEAIGKMRIGTELFNVTSTEARRQSNRILAAFLESRMKLDDAIVSLRDARPAPSARGPR